ncbi:hypothetical protein KKG05_11605 [bacterium]|nr:hypothetical protein [bacterium]
MKMLTLSGVNLTKWIGIIGVLSLLVSCSRSGDVLGPQTTNSNEESAYYEPTREIAEDGEEFHPVIYHYPEAADYPPAGYQLINFHNMRPTVHLDGDNEYDTTWVYVDGGEVYEGVARFIEFSHGGKVKWNKSEVKIHHRAWQNHSDDLWISMIRTDPPQPWMDFGPHGLIFDKDIKIKIYYDECELPEGVDPEDLELFYWNEETEEWENHTDKNDTNHMYLQGKTDHFSRYIIAARG